MLAVGVLYCGVVSLWDLGIGNCDDDQRKCGVEWQPTDFYGEHKYATWRERTNQEGEMGVDGRLTNKGI